MAMPPILIRRLKSTKLDIFFPKNCKFGHWSHLKKVLAQSTINFDAIGICLFTSLPRGWLFPGLKTILLIYLSKFSSWSAWVLQICDFFTRKSAFSWLNASRLTLTCLMATRFVVPKITKKLTFEIHSNSSAQSLKFADWRTDLWFYSCMRNRKTLSYLATMIWN